MDFFSQPLPPNPFIYCELTEYGQICLLLLLVELEPTHLLTINFRHWHWRLEKKWGARAGVNKGERKTKFIECPCAR